MANVIVCDVINTEQFPDLSGPLLLFDEGPERSEISSVHSSFVLSISSVHLEIRQRDRGLKSPPCKLAHRCLYQPLYWTTNLIAV